MCCRSFFSEHYLNRPKSTILPAMTPATTLMVAPKGAPTNIAGNTAKPHMYSPGGGSGGRNISSPIQVPGKIAKSGRTNTKTIRTGEFTVWVSVVFAVVGGLYGFQFIATPCPTPLLRWRRRFRLLQLGLLSRRSWRWLPPRAILPARSRQVLVRRCRRGCPSNRLL